MFEPYESQEQPREDSVTNYTPTQEESVYTYTPPREEPGARPQKQKTGWSGGRIVALALVCSLLGGALGAGGMLLGTEYFEKPAAEGNADKSPNSGKQSTTTITESNREPTIIDVNKVEVGKLLTQAEVYAANVNSTVGITTSITSTNYWGYASTSAAAGSGFIFSTDGYILTNYHVVEDSTSIKVTMYNGDSYNAKLIGYDESNDVAVLKIEAAGLVPVVLGNSDKINVGDNVVAIGNPLGELTFSLTAGSISAKDRQITMTGGTTMQLMQTDCAINSGNSGGALFNLYGEVIGITNAKYSGTSGSGATIDNIGFAIPINKARAIAETIIEKGYVSKPYVGISVTTVSEETQSYGLPKGAAIKTVTADSPASKAGLKVNDIITHVDGQEISTSTEIVSIVGKAAVGDQLVFTVYRQGKTMEITVTVGEQIQSVENK